MDASAQRWPRGDFRVPLAGAGWGDLPGELHREILRLVPLCDATAARGASREMRDEVDEVWRAWGIRAAAENRRDVIRWRVEDQCLRMALDFGPLVVWAFEAFHAHHLASMGLWRLAVLVAKAPDLNDISWAVPYSGFEQSPLMVAVQARWPAGRGADGKVEWAHALGDEEVARMVRVAVGMGADVNQRLQEAWPLMTYCAARGCVEAVKACLAAGAEVDAGIGDCYTDWWTALVHAGQKGHEAVVEALLQAGASAKVGRRGGDQTLTTVCFGHPTPGIVHRLVAAGSDVNAADVLCSTAIRGAAREGDLAVMEALVDLGAELTTISNDGSTAMHEAANGEVVRWLVARGLSIHGDGDNWSPLMAACGHGHIDAARALVELGADVRYRGRHGFTALHWMVCCGKEEAAGEMTRLLFGAGADAKAVGWRNRVPLHWVRHAACVDLLVDAGADLEARDRWGRTPIGVFASDLQYNAEVVLRLADRGADLVNTGGEAGLVERIVAKLRAQRSVASPADRGCQVRVWPRGWCSSHGA